MPSTSPGCEWVQVFIEDLTSSGKNINVCNRFYAMCWTVIIYTVTSVTC